MPLPKYLIFIHVIRLKDILLEGMTPDVANTIFSKFGVPNASEMEKGALKKYYIALVKKHHPDRGGKEENMRYINAAYDVLKTAEPPSISGRIDPSAGRTVPKDPRTKGMYITKITVDFRSVISDKLLYSGKCDRIDFLAIIRKLRIGSVYMEMAPDEPFDYTRNAWKTNRVVINVDADGFTKVLPDLVQYFRE